MCTVFYFSQGAYVGSRQQGYSLDFRTQPSSHTDSFHPVRYTSCKTVQHLVNEVRWKEAFTCGWYGQKHAANTGTAWRDAQRWEKQTKEVWKLIRRVGQQLNEMMCQEDIQHMRWDWALRVCVYGYVNAVRIMLCKLANHNKRGFDMFAFNSKLVKDGKAMEIFRQPM